MHWHTFTYISVLVVVSHHSIGVSFDNMYLTAFSRLLSFSQGLFNRFPQAEGGKEESSGGRNSKENTGRADPSQRRSECIEFKCYSSESSCTRCAEEILTHSVWLFFLSAP